MGQNSRNIIDLSEVNWIDESLVGKKAHELGILWELGLPIPKGFVITANYFKKFLSLTGIDKEINKTQALNHPALSDSEDKLFYPVRRKIIRSHIPHNLALELHNYYKKLSGLFRNRPLNIFSSSVNNKSISFSNIKGDANLILKIKKIWSLSLKEPIAIIVQESFNHEAKGTIITDRPTNKNEITQEQMKELINYCKIIQKHFYFPKEVEYVVKNNKLFITKVNPFTGAGDLQKQVSQNYKTEKILLKGNSINPGIVTGKAKVLHNIYGNFEINRGDIVILPSLEPTIFKKMKIAKAVVVDSILPNSLNKALFRKYCQIPTIEGVKNATRKFKNGNIVTVNGINGEIYSGGLIY